jgi:hypothetical protein
MPLMTGANIILSVLLSPAASGRIRLAFQAQP